MTAVPPSGPVRVMAAATLVTTLGSGLYLAGSTLFFTQVIKLSVASVGTGLAIAMFVGVLSGIPLGYLADRRGPVGLYIGAQAIQAVAMFLFPFAHSFAAFLVLVILAAIGQRGGLAVSGALIARISEPGQRAKVRGYLRAVINLGMGLGVAAAGFALQLNTAAAYTVLILVNGLSFLCAAGLLFMIPAVQPVPKPDGARRTEVLRDRPYFVVSLLCGVLAFQYDVTSLILPLWLVSHTSAPRWWLSVLMVLSTAIVVLFQVRMSRGVTGPVSGAAALRRTSLYFLVSCAVVGSAAGLPPAPAAGLLLVGVAIQAWAELGLAAGSFELGYGLAPDHAQGQYQGMFNLVAGVVRAVSPVLLTTLCLQWGRPGWIVLGAVLALAGFAVGPLTRWAVQTRSHLLVGVAE